MKTVQLRNEELAKVSKELMLREPFYGLLLLNLNKVWSDKIPTAGVSKNGINFQLTYSPKFWDELEFKHRIGLTKHELLHIGFFHLTDYEHLSNRQVANIAMDCCINQYIDNDYLPPGGILPSSFPELNLELKKGTQYYYDELMKAQKNNTSPNLNQMINGMGQGKLTVTIQIGDGESGDGETVEVQLPDHSTWEEFEGLSEAEKKLIAKQTEHILKEVAEQVVKSRGTVPGEFVEIIDKILNPEPPKFDWRGYLRRFAGSSYKTYTRLSRNKFNKRFSDNPGLRIKFRKHILVAIDTSGSVSTDELKEFMHEIHHMHKTGSEITIIHADTSIRYKGKYNPRDEQKIHGRGGTSFEPVIDYYNENYRKYNALIYLTDGEAPAPEKPRGRMLWVISSKSNMNESLPGPKIKLEI